MRRNLLFVICLISLLSSSISQPGIGNYVEFDLADQYGECPGDDMEAKDLCAIQNGDTLVMNKKCSSDERCVINQGCQKVIKLKELGNKCNYNSDCYSKRCESNKCAAAKDGEAAENDFECEIGSRVNDNGVCAKIVYQGHKCSDSIPCAKGLECNDGICVKWSSIINGLYCVYDEVCKSGICLENECVEIKSFEECTGLGNTTYVTKDGKTKNGPCVSVYTKPGEQSFVPAYSKATTYLWKKYVKDAKIKELDILEYNKKERSRIEPEGSFGDFNNFKKYYRQYYAEQLTAMGIIDREGDYKKKCELNWLTKHSNLSGGFINYKIAMALIALVLL